MRRKNHFRGGGLQGNEGIISFMLDAGKDIVMKAVWIQAVSKEAPFPSSLRLLPSLLFFIQRSTSSTSFPCWILSHC